MLYPILSQSRSLIDLGGVWKFKLDTGNGFTEKWYEQQLEDSITMPVPASYNDLKDNIQIRDHYGWVFYQREISIPNCMRGERLVLRFGAVTHTAKVYLNGQLITEHKGGFLPFEVVINEYIKDGDNLLTVAVDNRIDNTTLPVGGDPTSGMNILGMKEETGRLVNKPNFDFFNYCGVTRPVKLYTTPNEYIRDITIVSDVKADKGILNYLIETEGNQEVTLEVHSKEGEIVAKAIGHEGVLEIENPVLWEPLAAYLYEIHVKFGSDIYVLPYGIRTVKVEGKQFLINGKAFYFKGYGKHEDTYPAGRGLNIPMDIRDISLMKWQGANSIRTSHYPYSEEMMRLCDEEGIVVIDETPAVGLHLNFGGGANFKNGVKVETFDPINGVQTFEHHKDVIGEMIARDKNHACVVMWSIANEPDSSSKGAYEYFKPLFDLARELDPQKRPCTLVSFQSRNPEDDCTHQLSDVICINRYYGWYVNSDDFSAAERAMRREFDFLQAQGKPFMMTEYGADTVMGFHDTLPVMYTEEFQVEYYKMNHRVMDDYKMMIGEQVWNFADFATSQNLLRVQGNKKGIFTRDRKPKMVAHYLRNRWKEIPDFNYKA